jgi:hypothetical protein
MKAHQQRFNFTLSTCGRSLAMNGSQMLIKTPSELLDLESAQHSGGIKLIRPSLIQHLTRPLSNSTLVLSMIGQPLDRVVLTTEVSTLDWPQLWVSLLITGTWALIVLSRLVSQQLASDRIWPAMLPQTFSSRFKTTLSPRAATSPLQLTTKVLSYQLQPSIPMRLCWAIIPCFLMQ